MSILSEEMSVEAVPTTDFWEAYKAAGWRYRSGGLLFHCYGSLWFTDGRRPGPFEGLPR